MNPTLPMASAMTPRAASSGASVLVYVRGERAPTTAATSASASATARATSASTISGVTAVGSNGTPRR